MAIIRRFLSQGRRHVLLKPSNNEAYPFPRGTSYKVLGSPARKVRTRGVIEPPYFINRRGLSKSSRHYLYRIGSAFFYALVIAVFVWATLMTIADGVGVIDSGFYGDRAIVREEALKRQQEIEKRMRYHGTLHAYMDDNGEWRFNRNGKECRLW